MSNFSPVCVDDPLACVSTPQAVLDAAPAVEYDAGGEVSLTPTIERERARVFAGMYDPEPDELPELEPLSQLGELLTAPAKIDAVREGDLLPGLELPGAGAIEALDAVTAPLGLASDLYALTHDDLDAMQSTLLGARLGVDSLETYAGVNEIIAAATGTASTESFAATAGGCFGLPLLAAGLTASGDDASLGIFHDGDGKRLSPSDWAASAGGDELSAWGLAKTLGASVPAAGAALAGGLYKTGRGAVDAAAWAADGWSWALGDEQAERRTDRADAVARHGEHVQMKDDILAEHGGEGEVEIIED